MIFGTDFGAGIAVGTSFLLLSLVMLVDSLLDMWARKGGG